MDELIRTAYIRGPLGPRGPQGPVGPKGEQGPIGLKGDKGDMGPMGPRGFQGPKGDPFTYEDFTEGQLEGLRGPQGPQGEKGPQGIQGIQGIQGEKGDKGDQGIQGIQGETGPLGPKGETGETGPQGPQGTQGEKGDPFTYEDFTAAQLEALRGPLGIQGPTGPQGEQGALGILGEQGVQGIQGPKGDTGDAFDIYAEYASVNLMNADVANVPVGKFVIINSNVGDPDNSKLYIRTNNTTDYPTGFKFLTDMSGAQGIQGPQGELGVQGVLGIQGIPGNDGHSPVVTASKSGSTTTIYVDGTSIATIEDGLDGQDGLNGTNGTNGSDGQDGNDGTDGITPTVTVTSISNGHNVAFSYGTGDSRNTDFNVMDGNVANQLQADWNLTDNTQADYIKNKPDISSAYIKTPAIDTNGHDYVDLGLTSGTLWATMNVGSSSEVDNGDYYQYGKGSSLYENTYQQSKYAGTENPLSLSVDTARQVWGGDWHMPTKNQWQELIDECTWTFTTIGNKNGYRVSKNGKSIFLPASGYCSNGDLNITGSYARYLSSTSFIFDNYLDVYGLEFDDSNKSISGYGLATGTPIRGVIDHIPNQAFKVAITGSYNDLTDKPTIPDISGKANSVDLATVATSGSYTDLSNKPTVDRVHITKDTQLSTSSLYIPNVALNSSGDYELNVSSLIKYDLVTQLSNGQTQCSEASFVFGAPATYSPDGYPCGANLRLYNQLGFSSSLCSNSTSNQAFWFNKGGTVLTSENCGDYSVAKVWRGTQAQYDLLTPDSNTIYIITSAS